MLDKIFRRISDTSFHQLFSYFSSTLALQLHDSANNFVVISCQRSGCLSWLVSACSRYPVDFTSLRCSQQLLAIIRVDKCPYWIKVTITCIVCSWRDGLLSIWIVGNLCLASWFDSMVTLIVESSIFADAVVPALILILEIIEKEVVP